MRPTVQETIAIEKVVCNSPLPIRRGMRCHGERGGTWGKHRDQIEEVRGKYGQNFYCGIHGKEWTRQGEKV